MANYFVNSTAGDDNNHGTSEISAFKTIHQALCHVAAGDTVYVKAAGPYTLAAQHSAIPKFTGGSWDPATRLVTKAGQFADYSYQGGDRIWLASASQGRAGWYAVAGVIDDDRIRLADDSLYPGGGLSDIHSDCTEAMGALFTAGSATNWIRIKGYTSSVEDAGEVTFEGGGVYNYGLLGLSGNNYYRIENMAIQNTLNTCFQWASGDTVSFRRCTATNSNGNHGWRCRDRGVWHDCTAVNHGTGIGCMNYGQVFGCTVSGCTSLGINVATLCGIFGCRVHDCPTGIVMSSHASLSYCTVFNCSSCGIYNTAVTSILFSVRNCTIDGGGAAGSVGIQCNASPVNVVNCILHNCETCLKASNNQGELLMTRNNLYNPCGGGTAVMGYTVGEGSIIGADPLFVDEANHDYRLRWASPARAAGWPSYLDIGAQQRKEPIRGCGIRTGGEM